MLSKAKELWGKDTVKTACVIWLFWAMMSFLLFNDGLELESRVVIAIFIATMVVILATPRVAGFSTRTLFNRSVLAISLVLMAASALSIGFNPTSNWSTPLVLVGMITYAVWLIVTN